MISSCGCSKKIISKMRHKVDVLSVSTTRQDGGIRISTWSILKSIFGKLEPIKSSLLLEALDRTNDITHKLTIRYTTGFTVKDRIRYGSRFFFIRGFNDIDEQKRFLILNLSESEKAKVSV